MSRTRETHILVWRGRRIEVRYDPCWLGRDGPFSTAHLELEVLEPERSPLPVTETGYRSHFISADDIAVAGGPVAYAQAWLNEAATSRDWQDREAAARQMSLF